MTQTVNGNTYSIMINDGMFLQDRGRDPDEDWEYDINQPAILKDADFDPSTRLLICAGEVSGYVLPWLLHYFSTSHLFGDTLL